VGIGVTHEAVDVESLEDGVWRMEHRGWGPVDGSRTAGD